MERRASICPDDDIWESYQKSGLKSSCSDHRCDQIGQYIKVDGHGSVSVNPSVSYNTPTKVSTMPVSCTNIASPDSVNPPGSTHPTEVESQIIVSTDFPTHAPGTQILDIIVDHMSGTSLQTVELISDASDVNHSDSPQTTNLEVQKVTVAHNPAGPAVSDGDSHMFDTPNNESDTDIPTLIVGANVDIMV